MNELKEAVIQELKNMVGATDKTVSGWEERLDALTRLLSVILNAPRA